MYSQKIQFSIYYTMIISVSRRSDIPALFPDWFIEKFQEGVVTVKNPFRPSQETSISLMPEDVTAFVFWTRFPQPFFSALDLVDKAEIPYYFLITINNYNRYLESRAPDLQPVLESLKSLQQRISENRIIWRYDPIILTREMNVAYHLKHFEKLAKEIAPYTYRVTTSFLDMYKKVSHRFKKADIVPLDLKENPEEMETLLSGMSDICNTHGLQLTGCSEKVEDESLLKPGKCIDNDLLNSQFGLELEYQRDKNQRANCRCHQSTDIGSYHTCEFNCLYCYAR